MSSNTDSRGPVPALLQALPAAVGLCAALAMFATPALAAKTSARAKIVLETPLTPFQPQLGDSTNFSFTVPGAASARAQTVDRAFRFTPSGQTENRKALSVGVAARVLTPMPSTRTLAAVPEPVVAGRAYNLDVSVAWKGFALNTGYTHADGPGSSIARISPLAGTRDALDVGVSYGGANWRTSLQGTAEERTNLAFTPLERRYSVALGGAYMVAPRLSVSGGVRYKLAPEPLNPLVADRADQSVYVGTNIAF